MKSLSRVQLIATPWTVAYQAPLSMGFPMQKHWSGLPFPSLGDLSNPGIELGSLALQADSLPSEPPGKPLCLHIRSAKREILSTDNCKSNKTVPQKGGRNKDIPKSAKPDVHYH